MDLGRLDDEVPDQAGGGVAAAVGKRRFDPLQGRLRLA